MHAAKLEILSPERVDPPVGVLHADSSRRITAVDSGFCELFACTAAALVGTSLDDLFSPKDRKSQREFDERVSAYDGGFIDLLAVLRPGGVDALTRIRVCRHPDGWIAYVENILAHPGDVLYDLESRRARWSSIVATSDEGVAILDEDGRLVELNRRFLVLTDLRSEHGVLLNEDALAGRRLFELLVDEHFAKLAAAARDGVANKKLRHVEVLEHRGRWLEFRLAPIHIAVRGHIGSWVTLRDVTAHRMLEAMSAELCRKNADIAAMLRNLGQGIFTVEPGLRVHPEYSAYLEELLGTGEIAGRDVMTLLFEDTDLGADAIDRVDCTLNICLGQNEMMWDLNSWQLPIELRRGVSGAHARTLAIDWVPFVGANGDIEKIMVVLRDDTELRLLQADSGRQRQELEAIGQILHVDERNFAEFIDATRESIAQVRATIESDAALGDAEVAGMFRAMHTVKGNARTYGFVRICDAAHRAEDGYDTLRKGSTIARERLLAELADVETLVGEYGRVAREKLGRRGDDCGPEAIDEGVGRELLAAIDGVTDAWADPARAHALLEQLRAQVERTLSSPLGAVLERAGGGLRKLAARDPGKPSPEIVATGDECRIDRSAVGALADAFVHLLTNAYDHGIEPAVERAAAGKPARGRIEVECTVDRDRTRLTVRDDGRGLAIAKLRHHLAQHGAPDPRAVAELVFRSGVSSSADVTMTSGRGVGLGAVRSIVEQLGGTIELHLLGAIDDVAHARFELRLELPRALLG